MAVRKLLRASIERVPRVANLYRTARDLLDRNASSTKTPWGFTLAGNYAMARGDFEQIETKLVREMLKEVDILVNIGANVGYYCCHALSMNRPVIAIEPVPRNVHYLLRNIYENKWGRNAEVVPVAAWNQSDIHEMWGGNTGASTVRGWAGAPDSYVTLVPTLTLDRILGNSLNGRRALIIADIEGAEHAMLQGAHRTLNSNPAPTWLIEIVSLAKNVNGVHGNPLFKATFDIFYNLGYSAYAADSPQRRIEPDEVHTIALGQRSLKVHNFIFRK